MTINHTHPCAHCAVALPCGGTYELNHDGMPEVICSAVHRPGGVVRAVVCERCELLIDLAAYFDDHMDINDEGGPNTEMGWYQRILAVLR
jgi:hypothetical protein